MIALRSNRISYSNYSLMKNILKKCYNFKRLKEDKKIKKIIIVVFLTFSMLYSSILIGSNTNFFSFKTENGQTNVKDNFNDPGNKITTQSRENPSFGDTIWSMKVNSPLVRLDFSPDGRYLVTEHENRNLYIWDITTGDLIKTLKETFFILNGIKEIPLFQCFSIV